MTDSATLSPQRQPEDQDAALRPKSPGDFVGKEAGLNALVRVALTRVAG